MTAALSLAPAAPRIRPPLRYHGGKWRIAPWILAHFPEHETYTEAFGGAAGVLLRKPRSVSEIYNDLDHRVVNLFRVLRHPAKAERLVRLLTLTPYSREEHTLSYEPTTDEVESARRMIVRSMFGFGSRGATSSHRTGFRTSARRSHRPASDWANYPASLRLTIERLEGVLIEARPAAEVLRRYDDERTLHYVDPPYPHSTRTGAGTSRAYAYEMSDDDHWKLAEVLHSLHGFVVLSGYGCDLYDRDLFPTWHRVEREAMTDSGGWRTEVLWLNARAADALRQVPR